MRTAHPDGAPQRPRIAIVDPSNFIIPYDLELLHALRRAGMSVTLVCRRARPAERPLSRDDADTRFYHQAEALLARPALRSAALLLKGVEHVVDSARFLGQISAGYQVLHYQWLVIPAVDRLLLSLLRRDRALVVTVHDTEPLSGSSHSALQTRGLIRALASADQLIVHTQESGDRLLRAGLPAERLSVIAHPILPLAAPQAGSLPMRQSRWWKAPVRLLLFGHLKAYKGIEVLLTALQSFPAGDRQRMQVLLAGRSSYGSGVLERRIDQLGLADRVFVEDRFLTDGELAGVVHHASVLLFPYLQIDASGAILSVLPLGKPMILSRLPTILQSIPRSPRIVYVEPGDPVRLAAAIAGAVQDAENPATDGEAGAGVMPTWDDMASRLHFIYEKALSSRRAG